MLRQIKPELAAEPKTKSKLDHAFIEAKLNDPNWIAEEKFDGARYLAHFESDRLYFTSRRTSDVTGLQVEKGLNLPHLNVPVPALVGTVLDGEVTVGRTSSNVTSIMGALPEKAITRQASAAWCQYRVWDVLYYKGTDVQALPLHERKAILKVAAEEWKSYQLTSKDLANLQAAFLKLPGITPLDTDSLNKLHASSIELVEFTVTNKKKLLTEVWDRGGEGLVLKNLDSLYEPDKRDKNSWIKLKQHLTFDVVIMGYTQPDPTSIDVHGKTIPNRFYVNKWISAVRFGQYKSGVLVELGQASGLSDALRAKITDSQKELLGTVMEVKAQEQIPESGALRHPRVIMLRPDKDAKDCKFNPTV